MGPVASEPFVRAGRSRLRTGPLGLGHVVFNVESVEQIDRVMPFYASYWASGSPTTTRIRSRRASCTSIHAITASPLSRRKTLCITS